MRRPIIAGNWKMFKTLQEAEALAAEVQNLTGQVRDVDVAVLPPYPFLTAIARKLDGSSVALGAQDLFVIADSDTEFTHFGARTSMVSGPMLASVGCTYVAVGHSERRQFFGDTDAIVGRKVRAAFDCGLVPILCVGEHLDEREAGQTLTRVGTQVREGLRLVRPDELSRVVIAYEPVWAIGTGKVATPAMAQEVHAFIRSELREQHGPETADAIRIQYGGSVTPDTVAELMAEPDVDGALVGGASLKADSFSAIVRYRERRRS